MPTDAELDAFRNEDSERAERVASMLREVGDALAASGDAAAALEGYDDALATARDIGDAELRAAVELTALSALGNCHYGRGDFRRARAAHMRALTLSRKLGDKESEGSDLGNLGAAYLALGEADKSAKCHEAALAIARALGDAGAEAIELANLGNAMRALGKAPQAVATHLRAVQLAERSAAQPSP